MTTITNTNAFAAKLDLVTAKVNYDIDLACQSEGNDANYIRRCVKNYSKATYQSKLGYAAYLTKQKGMAIFGRSDWQKARKELVNLIATKDNFYKTWTKDKKWVKKTGDREFIADKMLTIFVKRFNTLMQAVDVKDGEAIWKDVDSIPTIKEKLGSMCEDFEEYYNSGKRGHTINFSTDESDSE